MKEIAVLTWHYYSNYGSVLQAYAVQEAIKSMGHSVTVLDYRKSEYNGTALSRIVRKNKLLYRVLCSLCKKKTSYLFTQFIDKYFSKSSEMMKREDLIKEAEKYDCVVAGSDQLWAPNVYDPIYMLDFVPSEIAKISYAVSIGLDEIPADLVNDYKQYLSRFQAISVREKQGAQLLEQRCEIQSEVVLDPTLLVSAEHWEKLEKKIKRQDRYIFCYFLNKTHKYKKAVQAYASKSGIEVIGCSANPEDGAWMTVLGNDIGPREFLWLIHHAAAVFTDSYHGTIFSLLYHKPFITFERFEISDKICQNSRIYQLDDHFSLSKRIIRATEDTEIVIDDFDYESFESRLCELRKSSMEYLRNALEG